MTGIAIVEPAEVEETGTCSMIDLGGDVGLTTPTGSGVKQFAPKGVCGVRGVIGVNGVIGGIPGSEDNKSVYPFTLDKKQYTLLVKTHW